MSDSLVFAREILRQEAQTIEDVAQKIDDRFLLAVEKIVACAGNVIVCGIGKAGWVGQKISATMASTGTPSHFLHPAEAVHGDLGRIGKRDVVLMLSQSGETEEVTKLLPSLRLLGLVMIAITGNEFSTLGKSADIVLPLGNIAEADSLGLAPSSSTAAMIALGDAIALVASRQRHFQAEDFARFHPGGALGRKLSLVDEYFRPLDQCRVAPASKTVRDVFVEHRLPGRRSGAILLLNEDQTLAGIFTDSDLAKLFEQRSEEFLDKPIRNVMTAQPASVLLGTRMLEAISVMGERRISELPVVDAQQIPQGLIDITDLISVFPECTALWPTDVLLGPPTLKIA